VSAGAPERPRRARFAVALGARPLPGQSMCGDACEVFAWSRGTGAVIADGLGHGPLAAEASRAFCDSVRENSEEPMAIIFERAHHALLKTRGAVAAVARFDESRGQIEIGGLGNITVLLQQGFEARTERPVIMTGIVGTSLRAVRPFSASFGVGDVLLMHTDGVRAGFDVRAARELAPQAIVDRVLQQHSRASDDAACIVAQGELTTASMIPERRREPPSPAGARTIPIVMRSDVDCAATEARRFSQEHGLSPRAQWEISIATSELATNIVKHAGRGEIRLSFEDAPGRAVVVEAVDRGGGIPDIEAAMVDGFSEGALRGPDRPRGPSKGLGVGLGAVRRLMSKVDVTSSTAGTRVVARKQA
jgi:negative regulator of sigma-B (phosphoserine phosphatase)